MHRYCDSDNMVTISSLPSEKQKKVCVGVRLYLFVYIVITQVFAMFIFFPLKAQSFPFFPTWLTVCIVNCLRLTSVHIVPFNCALSVNCSQLKGKKELVIARVVL